jgi:hypothetical protein
MPMDKGNTAATARRSAVVSFEILSSKSANAERSRARSAAGFDDSLAAVAGGAAVITMMAGCVVKIAALGRRKPPRGIADDEGSLG